MSKRIAAASSRHQTLRRACSPCIETLENRQLLSLVIDLRVPGGGKTATVNSVGQHVSLQIWATVTGSNASGSDEGMQTAIGSLLSTNVGGGAANGSLSASPASPFNSFGSQSGVQHDLDGDGDLDVGSNDPEAGDDYFAARSGGVTTTGGTVSGASKSFMIGTADFVVTSLKTGGTTNLNFRIRPGITALWREDGVASLKNPTTGSMSVGAPVVLSRGGTPTGNTIFGQVFNDTNKNGTHEAAEPGLGGATVYLDADNDGVKDTGEKSTTSDSGGNYSFGSLAAGTYHVREIAPTGFKLVGTSVFNTTFSSANGGSFSANFVNQSTSTGGNNASISGILFNDGNKNGVFDAGESLLATKKMYIDANSNGKFDTGETSALTNASGAYSFTGLAAGTYRVGRADTPVGYSFSTPAGGIAVVTLSAGQAATGKNFGVFQGTTGGTGSISGTVWSDTDKDGVIDAGETLLSGKKMFIDANKNGKLDTGEKTAITNASGVYSFTGLAAGTYEIRRGDTPTGFGFSTPASGFYDVVLAGGQNVTGKNFGAVPISGGGGTGSISGTVFSDTDKDGVLDATEARLASKKIYIDKNKNGIFDAGDVSVLSNASGVYTFTGLAAGTYRIRRADLPSGFKLSVPSAGFYDITISAGQVVTGKNIGAVPV